MKNFSWKRLDQTKIFEIKLKKSSIYQAILVYVLKQSIEVHLKCLANTTNHSLTKSHFSWQIEAISSNIDLLKSLTLYRRRVIEQWFHYRNYPNSMRMMYKQINKFMENKIPKCITDFWKRHGSQYSLVIMPEKWRKVENKKENISTKFMDLSKTFDTINHNLLLAKLRIYGFLCSYVKSWKQRRSILNLVALKKW